ncbi:MAG: ATP-binding protein [Pseudomonadota bacterium]
MLPPDIQSMVDFITDAPEATGAVPALLVLLENHSDSDVIINALSRLSPDQITDEDQRARAAALLDKTEAYDLAKRWRTGDAVPANGKVVSLHPGSGGHRERTVYGQAITFEDIGGLEKVKQQIRRKIIRPFEDPGLFAKFKRKAGGGVLLYGPPGCGKTMLARAVAHEVNAQFIEVRASEILDRYIGVAEQRISDVFAEARADRPAVLFFDEIEALAQRRQIDASRSVNTTVSTLLTEMNGFDTRNEGILLLGATNIPWSLDSAFRRPSRFDRTLFVPPPDKIARAFILKNLLEDRPCSELLDLEAIVARTSGYSGADLASLVEAAVDYAIDTSLHKDAISLITNDHFAEAFGEVRSTTGEWLAEARNFGEYANQDGLYDDLKDFLKKHGR